MRKSILKGGIVTDIKNNALEKVKHYLAQAYFENTRLADMLDDHEAVELLQHALEAKHYEMADLLISPHTLNDVNLHLIQEINREHAFVFSAEALEIINAYQPKVKHSYQQTELMHNRASYSKAGNTGNKTSYTEIVNPTASSSGDYLNLANLETDKKRPPPPEENHYESLNNLKIREKSASTRAPAPLEKDYHEKKESAPPVPPADYQIGGKKGTTPLDRFSITNTNTSEPNAGNKPQGKK